MIAIDTPRPVASSCALSTSIVVAADCSSSIRIVVSRRLRVEQVHALCEIDARIAVQRCQDLRDVAAVRHRQHFAIDVERLDRPAFDAAQIVLVRELRQDAIDGRRGPVAALQVALIRRAREACGKRRGLPDGHEYLPRGRVSDSVAAAVAAVRTASRARAAASRRCEHHEQRESHRGGSDSERPAKRTRGSVASASSSSRSRAASAARRPRRARYNGRASLGPATISPPMSSSSACISAAVVSVREHDVEQRACRSSAALRASSSCRASSSGSGVNHSKMASTAMPAAAATANGAMPHSDCCQRRSRIARGASSSRSSRSKPASAETSAVRASAHGERAAAAAPSARGGTRCTCARAARRLRARRRRACR